MHLLSLSIDDPTVSDDLLVWRLVVSGESAHQAGVEPAAILVTAFEIHISGEVKGVASCFQNRDTRRTRIEPHIEDVGLFSEIIPGTFRTFESVGKKFGLSLGIPRVCSFFRKDVSDMIDDFRVGNRFIATIAVEDRNRNAPTSLTRNAPVGPTLEHVTHSALTPGGKPIYLS